MELDYYYMGHLIIILLVFFLLFCLFTLVMLLMGSKSSLHLVTANIMGGHLLAGLLIHPGSIRLDLLNEPLTSGYCWLWNFLIWVYMCFVGYSMIAYSIDRFVYIQNPVLHESRFSKKLPLVAVIVLPWILSVIFSAILLIDSEEEFQEWIPKYHIVANATTDANTTILPTASGDLVNTTTQENMIQTMDMCTMVMNYYQFHIIANLLLFLPVICNLTLGITTLTIWCCYTEHATAGTIYYSLGDDVRRAVRNSVIAVSLLNFLGVVFIISSVISHHIIPMKTTILSLFGVIQGVVWLITTEDTRDRLVHIGQTCCGLRKSGPRDEVHYNSGSNENVAIHQGV